MPRTACLEGGCNSFLHDVGTFLPTYTASRHVIQPNLTDLLRYYLSLYFCLSTSLSGDPSFCVRPQSSPLIILSSHLTWMSLLRPAARYSGCCF